MRASRQQYGLSLALLVAAAAVVGGCRPQLPENKVTRPEDPGKSGDAKTVPAQSKADPNVHVGAPLYKTAEMPKFAAPPAAGTEPVVIPNASTMFEDRQMVSAETDGTIELIATQMTRRPDGTYEYKLLDGAVVKHDPRNFDVKKLHPKIAFNPREVAAYSDNPQQWVPYYKLRDGDLCVSEQILCQLDDSQVRTRR